MEFLRKNKWLLIAVLGGALILYVYFTYFAGSEEPLLSSTADSESSAATQELISALSNLRTIKLDEAIFQDPVFISLSDFGVTIPAQPVGRRNPFQPVAGSVSTPSPSVPGEPN